MELPPIPVPVEVPGVPDPPAAPGGVPFELVSVSLGPILPVHEAAKTKPQETARLLQLLRYIDAFVILFSEVRWIEAQAGSSRRFA
jgi:hypothetical protein